LVCNFQAKDLFEAAKEKGLTHFQGAVDKLKAVLKKFHEKVGVLKVRP